MNIPGEFRKAVRTIILWGLAVFIVVNAFSWSPGYGGRNDKKPGMEVERYFGWPACFRAELWRSDHAHEVDHWVYVPPIPLTSETYFVYTSNSITALLLNVILVVCVTSILILLKWVECQGRVEMWMIVFGVALAIGAILIVKFADETSTYL